MFWTEDVLNSAASRHLYDFLYAVHRYEDYPDLKRLVSMKDEMVSKNITPSYWLKVRSLRNLITFHHPIPFVVDCVSIDR